MHEPRRNTDLRDVALNKPRTPIAKVLSALGTLLIATIIFGITPSILRR